MGGLTMTTAKQREAEEARERLLEWIKPGDTVYCVLRHVSQSGMSRVIAPIVFRDNEPLFIGWNVARLLDFRFDSKKEGVKVGGAGMDMGFHLVYSLSSSLFGDGYALTSRWL